MFPFSAWKVVTFLPYFLSLRQSFLESLLQPESLRLDWLLLAVSHDAPPSTSTMDDEGNPRYRNPLFKLWCSFGMELVYSHIAFWAYFRNSSGNLSQVMVVTRLSALPSGSEHFLLIDPIKNLISPRKMHIHAKFCTENKTDLFKLFHGPTLRALDKQTCVRSVTCTSHRHQRGVIGKPPEGRGLSSPWFLSCS